jgi:hypothetical protein
LHLGVVAAPNMLLSTRLTVARKIPSDFSFYVSLKVVIESFIVQT